MAQIPWDYIEPGNPGDGVPNQPSPEGEMLGKEVARMTAAPLAMFRETFPDEPGPCSECAFVAGTVPNRCLATVANALKCAVEREPFYCHKGLADDGEPLRLCAGYVAANLDLEVRDDPHRRAATTDAKPCSDAEARQAFRELVELAPPPQWLLDMIEHYHRTGESRPEDLRRLFGDPAA